MHDERYKQIMTDLGMPNSRSLLVALQQVANEVGQECAVAERETQKWISVKDRLPDDEIETIVSNHPFNKVENGLQIFIGLHINGVWYTDKGDDLHPPTHWMPLPELPAGEIK